MLCRTITQNDICPHSNKTYCTSITMRLEVIPRGGGMCAEQVVVPPKEVRIPIQSYREFTCPDVDMLKHRNLTYTITWYHVSSKSTQSYTCFILISYSGHCRNRIACILGSCRDTKNLCRLLGINKGIDKESD